MRSIAILTLLAFAPAPALADAKSATDIVSQVQKFYAGVNQVQALFREYVTVSTFGTTKTSDGKLYLQKPGKMRWDYVEKVKTETRYKKSFISDGTTLFLVEHDNKQVTKKNLSQNLMPVVVSFLYGKGDLRDEFNAALDTTGTYGGKGDEVVKLTPKQPSAQYKHLTLVVAPEDGHVKESVIVDASNNVTHFKFYSPDFKTAIDTKTFEFNPASAKNYRIVDADAQQGSASGSSSKKP
jgi:outer membrane lipoprotein carrier protein